MLAPLMGGENETSTAELAIHQHQFVPTRASATNSHLNSRVPSEPEVTPRIRRTGRACDECRGRKIKCDGRHPCQHCSLLELDCTYDQPNKRSSRLSRKEIDELESKLERAQSLLKALLPNLDVDDPNLDANTLSKLRLPSTETQTVIQTGVGTLDTATRSLPHTSTEKDVALETVLEATGQLDLDDQGNWSYHGYGSSSAFIRRLGEQFGNISDSGAGKNTVLRLRSMPQIRESPGSTDEQSCKSPMQDSVPLPPRDVALDLTSSALNEACVILRFIHQPSFYSMFDRLYLVDPEQYGYEENKFLPLLYAVIAVGYLFSNSERAYFGSAHAVSEGEKYFVASRRMLDLTECRDMWSLQAVVFIAIFLHSSAKMSTCHSYICAAMAASLQMGLHRREPKAMNPIERESRKRIFWAIRTMETYISAILGLPRTIGDDDIDQEMPLEIDDQYITREGILPTPDGQVSMATGFNAHTKLVQILGKVITKVYPTKCMQKESSQRPRAYVVIDANVREVEGDLQLWATNLPMHLRPGADSPRELLRVQHHLRLAFTHVQMVLYRPFLHYISQSKTDSPTSGQCYAYAAACVDVGRNIIHNARQMEKQDTLNGPYWFSIYTTFCATLALVFYVWENVEVEGTLQTLKDAEYGRDVLVKLGYKSMAAARHSEILAIIFTRLPGRLGKAQATAQSKTRRKRHTSQSKEVKARETHSGQKETDHSSYEYQPQSSTSVNSQISTQAIHPVELGSSASVETPQEPCPVPETFFWCDDFSRFLGPDSIEDMFGLQPLHPSGGVLPDFGSTVMNHPQNVDSLDQYVSTLDMQKELGGFDNSSNGLCPLHYEGFVNSTTDDIWEPFVPLSPYLMQMHTPDDNSLVSRESNRLNTEDYYVVDQNDNLREI